MTKQIHDFLRPAGMFAMGTPTTEHHACTLNRIEDRCIVVRTDRVGGGVKRCGISGHQGEDIDDLEAAVPRKRSTAPPCQSSQAAATALIGNSSSIRL